MKIISFLILFILFTSCSDQKTKAVRKSLLMPKQSEIPGNKNFKKAEKKIEKRQKKLKRKKKY